jgi:hypothetical protein
VALGDLNPRIFPVMYRGKTLKVPKAFPQNHFQLYEVKGIYLALKATGTTRKISVM